MKLAHNFRQATARTAFTLVELLVVIAIIVILVSLLMVGVFKALDTAYEAQTRTDVTQIAAAVQAFKTKYQVSYVPSRIILCKDYLNYFVNRDPHQGYLTTLHGDSVEYLQRVFPRITTPLPGYPLPRWALSVPSFPAWATLPPYPPAPDATYIGIDWNQNNAFDQVTPFALSVYLGPNVPILGSVLEGEQCLVFFTGGIPNPTNGTLSGFSTDASNPANPVGDRVPPFFEFRSNRLTNLLGTAPGFPSYLDGYGKTPYAFFSSYKTANGYNRYVYVSNPYIAPVAPLPGSPPVTSDCQALSQYTPNGVAVFPYAQGGMDPPPPNATPAYLNPQTFQLISAGKDNYFGNGTVILGYPPVNAKWLGTPSWSPGTASAVYQQGQKPGGGYDDVANFYDRLLGVPTQ